MSNTFRNRAKPSHPAALFFTIISKTGRYCKLKNLCSINERRWDSSLGIATVLRAGRSAFDARQGFGIFLFATAVSRPALEYTQPPIQWILGSLSLRVKRPGRETDDSPPSGGAEAKNVLSPPPQSPFMAWCFAKHKSNFTFTLSINEN
jgi:hypothetical protein